MTRLRAVALALGAGVVLTVAGCSHSNQGDNGAPVIPTSESIATVNGKSISYDEFYKQLQGFTPTQQNIGIPVGQTVLRQLVMDKLMIELAAQKNVAPSQSDIQAMYQTQAEASDATSVKPFAQLIDQNGFSPTDVQQYQILPQLSTINLITQGQPPITPAQIHAYYMQHIARFTEPNRVHVQRIIVQNQQTAQQIYTQLKGGASWSTLDAQSVDRAFPGGDVPYWISLDNPPNPQLVPPGMLDQLKKATPGTGPTSIIPPYQFEGVYWIVQVLDKQTKKVIPESDVSVFIKYTLLAQGIKSNPQEAEQLQSEMQQYQSTSKISIPNPQYATLLQLLTAPPPPAPALSVPAGSNALAPASPSPSGKP